MAKKKVCKTFINAPNFRQSQIVTTSRGITTICKRTFTTGLPTEPLVPTVYVFIDISGQVFLDNANRTFLAR